MGENVEAGCDNAIVVRALSQGLWGRSMLRPYPNLHAQSAPQLTRQIELPMLLIRERSPRSQFATPRKPGSKSSPAFVLISSSYRPKDSPCGAWFYRWR